MAPRRKMKRKPVKVKKGVTRRKTKKKAKTKIRKDYEREYREAMKKQGIATISRLSNDECISNITGRISTRSLALDKVLRNQGEPSNWLGIPLSRVIEIFGPEHIGKSTILDQLFAEVQSIGGEAFLADTEVSRDRYYTANLGVDLNKLKYLEFEYDNRYIENVLNAVVQTINIWAPANIPMVIGWDALGSTPTHDELEKGVAPQKSHQPGAAAKAMALAQRLVVPKLAGTKISFVIINHEYDNINFSGFGKPKLTYGGHATRHMASLRIQLYSSGKWIKRSDGWIVGRTIVAKVLKNRVGEAMREAQIPMLTGQGTENMITVLEDLKALGIITANRSWNAINIDGLELSFQGWNGLRAKCDEYPGLEDKLYKLHQKVVL